MNNPNQAVVVRSDNTTLRIILILMLAIGAATFVRAQNDIPSGTISGSISGPSFSYSLSFSDAANATSPIGSVWYAWVPGLFFLPSTPTSASAPAGWSANIFNNSVQFIANSAADYITPGMSLSGFSYEANFSPAQLEAAPNSATSVAYSGGILSDAGQTFNVQTVPEPSSLALLILGGSGFSLIARRKLPPESK